MAEPKAGRHKETLMAQPNPRIKVSTQGNVTIAELVDKKILDEISIAEISRQLERLVTAAAAPRIVLDFASVAHMSSSMLGKLITLNKHVREHQGHMRLCNVQPAINEVFVITRLSEVFHVTQTRDQAVAELEKA